jgi:hypothetical protein
MKRIRNIFNIIHDLVVRISTFHYTPKEEEILAVQKVMGCWSQNGMIFCVLK